MGLWNKINLATSITNMNVYEGRTYSSLCGRLFVRKKHDIAVSYNRHFAASLTSYKTSSLIKCNILPASLKFMLPTMIFKRTCALRIITGCTSSESHLNICNEQNKSTLSFVLQWKYTMYAICTELDFRKEKKLPSWCSGLLKSVLFVA